MHRPLICALFLIAAGCTSPVSTELTLYSGRSKSLVEPLVLKFQEQTGQKVSVRYGDTAQLAVALMEEGDRSSADLFWGQDAGALGALAAAGLLRQLPDSLLKRVEPGYSGTGGSWIATSGRARTIAFSSERVEPENVPRSVFDLTAPELAGRVGWAPANGSFQSFVTAMRIAEGDDRTRTWLQQMKANGAVSYARNTAILQGIANGEVDFGLPNHYYLYRFKAEDPDFPVDQTSFDTGDVGNLVNVAGIGLLSTSSSVQAALTFVDFLTREEAQQYFRTETFELPVVAGEDTGSAPEALRPGVALDDLKDLEATLDMLREVGLL